MIEVKYKSLVNILNAEQEYFLEHEKLLFYRGANVRIGAVLNTLAGNAFTKALWLYFIRKDIEAFKQYCHLSSKLTLASLGKEGGEKFDTVQAFFIAVLSDNISVIEQFSRIQISFPEDNDRGGMSFKQWANFIQLALRGDFERLEKTALRASKTAKSSSDYDFYEFFLLFSRHDLTGLQNFIQEKHVAVKSADPRIGSLISWLGVFEGKLCWLKGMQVEIRHPLVPMELVRVEPLPKYNDVYDFEKIENSRGGWIGKAKYWIGKFSRNNGNVHGIP